MEEDAWGKDPSVRAMRRIFASIETAQATLLAGAGLKPMDRRLGRWRKAVLENFERRWAASAQRGIRLDEKEITDLYLYCLEEVLQADGIGAREKGPLNPAVERILAIRI